MTEMRRIVSVLDPELAIPSKEAKNQPQFWLRLAEWSLDSRPKLGPRTLTGLYEILADSPPSSAISPRELHKIVSRIASRVLDGISKSDLNCGCIDTWAGVYRPHLGDERNVDRLLNDLAIVPRMSAILLATDEACWQNVEPQTCEACHFGAFYHYSLSDSGAAVALRTELLKKGHLSLPEIKDMAADLFPNVIVHHDAWRGIGGLRGDRAKLLRVIVAHLGVLSDSAVGVWRKFAQNHDRIQALASEGVDASPESVKTRASDRLMRMRDIEFDAGVKRCEWHTKLSPDRNRVHFAVDDDRVYVGAIAAHLQIA